MSHADDSQNCRNFVHFLKSYFLFHGFIKFMLFFDFDLKDLYYLMILFVLCYHGY